MEQVVSTGGYPGQTGVAPRGRLSAGLSLGLLLSIPVVAFIGLMAVAAVGFLGSDDVLYWGGAGGWLQHRPYLGDSHWTLRHTLVIPMAISRGLLGDNMVAMALPTVLYAAGLIVVLALWISRAAGNATAAAAMAVVVTTPQFVLGSADPSIDVVEGFFVVLGFSLLWRAMDRGRGAPLLAPLLNSPPARPPAGLLLGAGVSLGLAMLSRETTVFAIAACGLLFLAGVGMQRAWYFVMGAGCAAVVGLEMLYFRLMAGTIFYRSTISVHHDATIDRWLDQGSGVPTIHPLLDPFTMLLLNHDFGLVTWFGIPLTIWLFRRGQLSPSLHRMCVLLATLAATWTLGAAFLWHLLPLTARYYLLPSILLAALAGVALCRLAQLGRPRLALVLGAILLAGNGLAISVDNRNYLFGERALVDVAAHASEPIHTDGQTRRRAQLLLEWHGAADRVVSTPPGPGDLYFFNPARNENGPVPAPTWTVVERHGLPPTIVQALAGLLPPGTVPPGIYQKLGRGHSGVTLYRLP